MISKSEIFNPLNPELNPICYLLALLAHYFLHVSRIWVKTLTLRLLMSYIYIYDISSVRVKDRDTNDVTKTSSTLCTPQHVIGTWSVLDRKIYTICFVCKQQSYMRNSGNFLPTFQGDQSVPSSRVKNNPEECNSQQFCLHRKHHNLTNC